MIRYKREWWSQIFARKGGVLRHMLPVSMGYLILCAVLYIVSCALDISILVKDDKGSLKFLGGFLSFLMIFRVNQCYGRYEAGKRATATYFTALESLLAEASAYAGDMSVEDEGAHELEAMVLAHLVNTARLCLAMAAAFKFHCGIAECTVSAQQSCAIPDANLPGVLFAYHRVRGLLYKEERQLVDSCCGLWVESDKAHGQGSSDIGESEPSFIGEPGHVGMSHGEEYHVNFRYRRLPRRWRRVGETPKNRPVMRLRTASGGFNADVMNLSSISPVETLDAGCSIPIVVMQLLRACLVRALDKKWGYPQRLLNIFEVHFGAVAHALEEADHLITMPFPLSYLQHCKFLFTCFSLVYPLSLSAHEGIWANIGSPVLLFMSLKGFDLLADQMENPLGDAVCDLNLMASIHRLEVRAYKIFQVRIHQAKMRDACLRPLDSIRRASTSIDEDAPKEVNDFTLLPSTPVAHRSSTPSMLASSSFNSHFTWMLLPPHIMLYCSKQEFGISEHSLRKLLEERRAASHCCGCLRCCPSCPCNCHCHCCQPDVDGDDHLWNVDCILSDDGFEEACMDLGLNVLTRFVCLKENEPMMHDVTQALSGDLCDISYEAKAFTNETSLPISHWQKRRHGSHRRLRTF